MARILLVGHDRAYQESLATRLRMRGHSVEVASSCCSFLLSRHARQSLPEIVIVDVTLFADCATAELQQFHQQLQDGIFPVLVLCYARANHGPRFELDIERLGMRYVYAE